MSNFTPIPIPDKTLAKLIEDKIGVMPQQITERLIFEIRGFVAQGYKIEDLTIYQDNRTWVGLNQQTPPKPAPAVEPIAESSPPAPVKRGPGRPPKQRTAAPVATADRSSAGTGNRNPEESAVPAT